MAGLLSACTRPVCGPADVAFNFEGEFPDGRRQYIERTEVQTGAVVDTCIEAPACHSGFLAATERTGCVGHVCPLTLSHPHLSVQSPHHDQQRV